MSETLTRDNLIAGSASDIITATKTLAASVGALARGTVLGKVTKGAVSVNALSGKGALTPDATTPLLANSIPGAYKAVCVTATTDSGTFEVFDPKGRSLGRVAVAATFANQIKFTIADGATDFVVGDTFSITVAAGSGQLKPVNSANVDGSESPYGVLLEAAPASDSTQSVLVALSGEFSTGAMVFGGSDTYATHEDALRLIDIHGKVTLAA